LECKIVTDQWKRTAEELLTGLSLTAASLVRVSRIA
jgi:hypothetical protein